MVQYTLYENRSADTRGIYPFFVDVQHPTLDSLSTRLVVPVGSAYDAGKYMARLCPVANIDGVALVLLVPHMTHVGVAALSHPCGDLRHLRDQIIAAIDFMVTGI